VPSSEPDIEKYCNLMEEIKLRVSVINSFITGKAHALYEPPTLESAILQLRKTLELIAFGSLIANRDAYSAVHARVSKTWNAGDLLRELETVNPDFYPVPVIQVQLKPGMFQHQKRDPSEYLTKANFKEVYGRCGVMAHAANPFSKPIDYAFFKTNLPVWLKQVMNLLNAHEIHLLDTPGMYTIHMTVHGDNRVHWYKSVPASAVTT
jgi:hypothetical protein